MKVTLENQFMIVTVESKPGYPTASGTEAEELKDLLTFACLGLSFDPDTVKEMFSE